MPSDAHVLATPLILGSPRRRMPISGSSIPAAIDRTVDCQRKTLRIDLVQISPRDGALRRGSGVVDHAPANVTEQQIVTFSCDKGQKSSAQRAQEREANNDPRNFIYMGPMSPAQGGRYGVGEAVDRRQAAGL
jgi:hypothetical protein